MERAVEGGQAAAHPSGVRFLCRRQRGRFASLAIRPRRVPRALSVFACVAHHRDGAPNHSRAPLHLRVVGMRVPCRRPSLVSLIARTALLAFRISLDPISAFAPDAVGLCLRRSLLPWHQTSLAQISRSCIVGAHPTPSSSSRVARCHDGDACVSRLSRSHLSVRLRCRRSSHESLVVTTASQITRASLALACRRCVPAAPSTLPRVARRHGGVACGSRLSRSHSGVCLRHRLSSLASLVITTASEITHASLALACHRRASPVPSTGPCFARCPTTLLAFCVSRDPTSACA